MTLTSLSPRQPRFSSMEDEDKLELSRIDYYLLLKSSLAAEESLNLNILLLKTEKT
jgi:hypothetical protein